MSEKKLNKKLIITVSIIAAVAIIATVAVIVLMPHRESVADVLDLGDRYMSELDYESAIREYRRAIEIDPKAEDAYLKLAEAYIAIGDVDSAIEALEEGYAATNSDRILARLNELRGGAASGTHSPDDAESIVMASTPQKTTYNVGDALDLTGLTLTVTYSDGATEVVGDGYTCDVKTLDEAGTQEVTVKYGEAETKFTVTVEDAAETETAETEPIETEPVVTEPPVTEPPVTEPPVTEPPVTEPPVTEPPVTEPPVTEPPVTEPPVPVTLSGISIRTNPSKTTYQVGDTLDTSGLTLTASYSDGHSETVTNGFSCSPTSLDTAGGQTVTVTYNGKTAAFFVNVEAVEQESYSGTWGDLSWTLDGDGVLTISGNGPINDLGGSDAWRKYTWKIKAVVFEGNITEIGDYAFATCTEITSITIPNSVTKMGERVFQGCRKLEDIRIESSVLGIYSFFECYSLKSVTVPATLKDWASAFIGCPSLTNVTIENGVTEIPAFAFSQCEYLTSITIPDSVTNIDEFAFHDCIGITSITIPNSVTNIGSSAFSGCTGLTSITIPSSVTEIGSSAFEGCTGITSITIPGSVTNIGYGVFASCPNLTLHAPAGSAAESYARDNNIPFSPIS